MNTDQLRLLAIAAGFVTALSDFQSDRLMCQVRDILRGASLNEKISAARGDVRNLAYDLEDHAAAFEIYAPFVPRTVHA